MNLSLEIYKTENLFTDGFYGCCVVMCTLCTFIFLLWLREQIIRVGAPDWLERPFNFEILQMLFHPRDNVNEENHDILDDIPINNNDEQDNEVVAPVVEEFNNVHEDANNNVQYNHLNEVEPEPEVVENVGEVNVEQQNEDTNEDEEEEEEENENDANNQPAENNAAVAQDWNPVIEWDRGGDDITWERVCRFVIFIPIFIMDFFYRL